MILFFFKLLAVIIVEIFFILFFNKLAKVINLLDYPDSRKRHQGNIPLVGGLCIFLTFIFIFFLIETTFQLKIILISCFIILFVGLYDDKFKLGIIERFFFQIIACLIVVGFRVRIYDIGQYNGFIIGLGGLGHMGVKFAAALGAKVVMITTSPGKSEDAKKLGADEVLISKDEEQMKKYTGSFDFLLNTVPVKHDLNPYIGLLKRDATMVLVGAIEPLEEMHGGGLIIGRKSVAGSVIGGIPETQEMLDFCGEHDIVSDIEMIDMQNINEAFDRVTKSDVKYRFVIDMKSLKN